MRTASTRYFWGIDPGKSGAIAIVSGKGECIQVEDFVEAVYLGGMIEAFKKEYPPVMCALEKAQPMPKQGVSGVFTYGTNFGVWLGVLGCRGVPHILVTPAKWKKTIIGIRDRRDKEQIRLHVVQRFPEVADRLKRKKDHNRAEAILIANWCRENYR